ncbi:hypothetical protein F5887DRAFT_993244 [Amanita rubescens]|nr:hypothetical protein F5887DRAFT_993244 [Amanita rubescens]
MPQSVKILFTSFPLEIDLEILGWTRTQDLLSLTETNKSTSQLLLSPISERAWELSFLRKSIPPLPPIYSYVKWARLIYGNHICYACRHNLAEFNYHLLRRLCSECTAWFQTAIAEPERVAAIENPVSSTERDVLELIPHTSETDIWCRYFEQDYEEVYQKLRAYETNQFDTDGHTLSDFRLQRLEFMEKVHELSIWSRSNRQRGVKHRVEAIIRKRFYELGFEECDFDRGFKAPVWIIDLDHEDITEREWNLIYESTRGRICDFRNIREMGERRKIITRMLFDSYLKYISPYQWAYQPKSHDIYDDRELAFLAISFQKDRDLSKADLDAAKAKIPEIAKNWMQNKRNALSSLMSSYLRDKGYLKEVIITPEFDILQLAIAVFACSPIPSATSLWDNPSPIPLIGPDAALLHKCDSRMCRIVFSEFGFEAAMYFVKLVGLDPFSTTYADMDKKDARFVRSDVREVALSWTDAVTHFFLEKGTVHESTTVWELLSPEETSEAKKNEEDPKLNESWCCNLCPVFGYWSRKNFYVVKEHIYTSHGVREPEVPRHIFVYNLSPLNPLC